MTAAPGVHAAFVPVEASRPGEGATLYGPHDEPIRMAKDLRTYLETLEAEAPEELAYIDREVDPEFEIASIVRKLEDEPDGYFPAILCEDVKGYPDWRVCTNLCGTDYRMALGIDATPEGAIKEYSRRVTNLVDPIEVDDGPVKDVIKTGEDADLDELPLLSHTPEEPAPFLDGEVFVTYDQENERFNTGIYRMMKKGPRKTGVFFAQGTHAYSILTQHEARDEPMEFAAVIGHHPVFIYGCQVQT
ncbi:MAG: UbiD family decarboxylase, partial [Halobacteriales archaeon]|nr:UbiD family decarboxylase [Halobacteriales archaeon]